MKTWIMTLPFLCLAGVAMAQGIEQEGASDQSKAAAPADPAGAGPAATPPKAEAPARAKAKRRTAVRGPKVLPKGDIRHCLDRKTQAEIIRCSEAPRRK